MVGGYGNAGADQISGRTRDCVCGETLLVLEREIQTATSIYILAVMIQTVIPQKASVRIVE